MRFSLTPAPTPAAAAHPMGVHALPSAPAGPSASTSASSGHRWLSAAAMAALLAGCATRLPPPPPPPVAPPPPPPVVVAPPPPPVVPAGALSYAKTPREYRRDAAAHLYNKNSERIFKGPMPPLLYAVGTLEVDLDPRGMVTKTSWMRAPSHAPEVMADIERSVREAAPYPVAVNLGNVTYTDTWLWHKSGRFQLDTLTEGQDANVPEPSLSTGRNKTAQPKKANTQVASENCNKAKTAKC